MTRLFLLLLLGAAITLCLKTAAYADTNSTHEGSKGSLTAEIDQRTAKIESKVIAWRRDIHQHPELGNREVRTAKLVADHLRGLGLEVQTEIAHTGVVALLRGDKPGPVLLCVPIMRAQAEEVRNDSHSISHGHHRPQKRQASDLCLPA